MSDIDSDVDLSAQITQLVDALEQLQREVEPRERRRLRFPTPRTLLQFTSEVTIPAAIVVLETNIRALKLLQRVLRLADGGRGPITTGGQTIRQRASTVSTGALERLDDSLATIQDSLEDRGGDDEVSELVREARELRAAIADELTTAAETTDEQWDEQRGAGNQGTQGTETEEIPIDVDAELESIKADLEASADGPADENGAPADDEAADSPASDTATDRTESQDQEGDRSDADNADDDSADPADESDGTHPDK